MLQIAENGLLALLIMHFLFSMPVIYQSHLLCWHVLMRLHMLELSVGKGCQVITRAMQSSAASDYCSVPVKCPWALKHNSQFWPSCALTRDITSIHLYRSCYIEMRYMGAYLGVGACLGHYGIYAAVATECMGLVL